MVNAILNGCNGAMGRVITDIVSKDDGIRIVAGVDVNPLKLEMCIRDRIRALVLRVGLETNDMNLFTAVFVAFSLSVPVLLGKWRARKEYSETGEEDS